MQSRNTLRRRSLCVFPFFCLFSTYPIGDEVGHELHNDVNDHLGVVDGLAWYRLEVPEEKEAARDEDGRGGREGLGLSLKGPQEALLLCRNDCFCRSVSVLHVHEPLVVDHVQSTHEEVHHGVEEVDRDDLTEPLELYQEEPGVNGLGGNNLAHQQGLRSCVQPCAVSDNDPVAPQNQAPEELMEDVPEHDDLPNGRFCARNAIARNEEERGAAVSAKVV